jgi:hypothetical protein
MTPHDFADWMDVFGNMIWIGVAGAALYFGVRYELRAIRTAIEVTKAENEKEHKGMRTDLQDHEHRLRTIEWRRPHVIHEDQD